MIEEKGLTRNKPTDLQVFNDLFAGIVAEEELTDHQVRKLNRLKSIHGMLLKGTSWKKIIKKIQSLYNLSESQISRDIQMTEQVYGASRKANKEHKRQVAEEMALEVYRRSKKAGDLRGMNAAVKNYISATGCNIEDPDMPEFEKLQPSPNIVIIPESIMQKMAERLNSGPVRFNPDKAAGDTIQEHEELDSATTGSDQSGD